MKTKKYVVFAGNPGSGKSTLLNCLMTLRADQSLKPEEKFKSGVSIGSGMTYELDKKILNGICYMDTPGLSDTEKRKKAAEAITEALKQNGEYQIIFVVTLEAGRVRPDDVTTMTMILESAKEISHYGVIFNKLGNGVMKKLTEDSKAELLAQVSLKKDDRKPIPIPFFLANQPEMEDEDDVVKKIPVLNDFLLTLLPILINKDNVDDIPTESYEELKMKMEKQLTEIKQSNEALQRKIEEDRKHYEKKIEEILQKERKSFEENQQKMKEEHDKEMTKMQEQLAKYDDKKQQQEHDKQMEMIKNSQKNMEDLIAANKKSHDDAMDALKKKRPVCIVM